MAAEAPRTPGKAASRRRALTALILGGVVCGMVGLAFAAVPLYTLFCQVTGFGGTTQVADAAPAEIGERADFPVSFFVDPDIVEDRRLDDVTTITLSYTFFARGEGVTEAALTQNATDGAPSDAAGPRPGSEFSYGG